MRKVISLLLIAMLAFGSFTTTFAQTTSDKILFDLKGLGIVSSSQSEEETVTRGEFTEMVVALMGMSKLAEQMAPIAAYQDVPLNASYAKTVALLSQIGIVNGVSDGKFVPNEPVSYEQAVKVLVVCTGYEEIAKNSGGWPTGYIQVAAKNGLLDNVKLTKPFMRKDLYQLFYNALDVKMLVQAVGSPEIKLEKSGDTLRTLLMDGESIYRMSGIITANAFSYTEAAVPNLKENQVVIDSVVYEVGNTNAFDLLGHKVDFFAAEKEDGTGYVLLYVRAAKDDKTIVIDADNIVSKNETSLSYLDENEDSETVRISGYTKVLYNGTRVLYPTDDLFSLENGQIKLFDHDDDGVIDVIMIEEYVSLVAESFNGQLFNFKNTCYYNGSNSLMVDTEKKGVLLYITDTEGNYVESFDTEHVVSIYEDKTSTRFRVIVSDKTVTGVLKMKSEDGLTIDDTLYSVDSSYVFDGIVGHQYTIYLNHNDEIAFAQSKHNSNYAYILGVYQKSTLAGFKAKLLLAGAVDFGVEVNEEDVNDTSQIPFLISQNGGVVVYDFADVVRIDGNTFKGATLNSALTTVVSEPVSYVLNEENKISALKTMDVCGGDAVNRSKYNVYEMVFGGSSLVDGFRITNDTQVICVPNGDADDEDCMVKLNIDINNNTTGYLVSGYDYDEEKKSAKLLIVHADMDSSQVRNINMTSSKASFVTDVSEKYNEETADTETVIEILNAGKAVTLKPMELTADNRVLTRLKAGDLITYITNNNGMLENAMIFRSFTGLKNDMRSSTADYTESFGTALQLVQNEVDTLSYVLVTKLTLEINGIEYTYNVPQRNKPPVYIYNTGNGIIESAKLLDIMPGKDRVYVLSRANDDAIRAIVIVR